MRDDLDMARLRRKLEARLKRIKGVVESESMFGNGDAYWVNGKEIAHFEDDATVEVRLTKGLIRERRAELKADPRVRLRPSGADWLTIKVEVADDAAFVEELVTWASQAHQPPSGAAPKPPPTGAELRRRQRFH